MNSEYLESIRSFFFLIFDRIFWSQSPWSKYGPLGAKGLGVLVIVLGKNILFFVMVLGYDRKSFRL